MMILKPEHVTVCDCMSELKAAKFPYTNQSYSIQVQDKQMLYGNLYSMAVVI